MRVLRTSVYMDADHPPLTTVVRDCDLADTIESAAHQLESSHQTPGVLVLNEVFEVQDEFGDIVEVTAVALQRIDSAREKNMALLYHWAGDTLASLTDTGVLVMDKPAPLDRVSMLLVFGQLKQHPNYREQTVIGFDSDGEEVRMDAGE